ncbi:MAG: hypothetical protein K5945_00445 [Bacteroidaceae bacterium]|nr:hypothetical protein [Bacteroidaceae bacterium]
MQIIVSAELRAACPQFVGAAVLASFENSVHSDALWQEIERFLDSYRQILTIDSIKEMPAIQATRAAYKRLGKDPSRYRPSGEALVRRALQGKELYQIDTAVDLINLASIAYGYSIGGFDADKIQGDTLTLGVGREGEPYEGIGRGPLNIAGLPVYRDAEGGIGTPTSDHERTKLELTSRRLLAIVNGYDGNREQTVACARYIQRLLIDYAQSDGGQLMEF